MNEFFSELDYSPAPIQAAMDEGVVEKWRVDASGTQWFKFTGRPMIHAVPPAADAASDCDDGLDEPTGLDEFERASLQDWADQLRQGAADDNVVSDDDTEGAADDLDD